MSRLFAFAYRVRSHVDASRATEMQDWLDHQSLTAIGMDRYWGGRVVTGPPDTNHILVVSDAADPNDVITLLLEAELLRMRLTFTRTAPMAIDPPSAVVAQQKGTP